VPVAAHQAPPFPLPACVRERGHRKKFAAAVACFRRLTAALLLPPLACCRVRDGYINRRLRG
jgi:hypothetical protein